MQKQKIKIESCEDLLSITISSKEDILQTVFLGVFLLISIWFMYFIIYFSFQIYSLPLALLILLLIIITLGALKLLDMIKWRINGKEVILLSSDKLKIEKKSLVWHRKEYLCEQIKNLRIQSESDSVLRWYTTGEFVTFVAGVLTAPEGLIRFDYGNKTIRFAYEIIEEDALKIVDEIKKCIQLS